MDHDSAVLILVALDDNDGVFLLVVVLYFVSFRVTSRGKLKNRDLERIVYSARRHLLGESSPYTHPYM